MDNLEKVEKLREKTGVSYESIFDLENRDSNDEGSYRYEITVADTAKTGELRLEKVSEGLKERWQITGGLSGTCYCSDRTSKPTRCRHVQDPWT